VQLLEPVDRYDVRQHRAGPQRVHGGSTPPAPASSSRWSRNLLGARRVAPTSGGSAASTKTTGAEPPARCRTEGARYPALLWGRSTVSVDAREAQASTRRSASGGASVPTAATSAGTPARDRAAARPSYAIAGSNGLGSTRSRTMDRP